MDSVVVVVVVVVVVAAAAAAVIVVEAVAGGCDATGDGRKRESPRMQDADGAR